jgi:drug/metabolite transporter (DMT)-like permease
MSKKQLWLLIGLTLVWGVNWPILKAGVQDMPPLYFRALSIILGVPVLGAALLLMRVPFRIPRSDWRELLVLSAFNMFIWHICIIIAVKYLSSGRAAILGYTMPVFSAMIGAWFYRDRLTARAWLGVGAAAIGVSFLLSNELNNLAGKPLGVALALFAAATWALGTQQLRRTAMAVPTLAISFWMTTLTAVVLALATAFFERDQWRMPSNTAWFAILFNAVMVFGFAHATWFYLARNLPPLASTVSVMLIPVLGVFTGAWVLGEVLQWQDFAAMGLMVLALGSVLWPKQAKQTKRPTDPRT